MLRFIQTLSVLLILLLLAVFTGCSAHQEDDSQKLEQAPAPIVKDAGKRQTIIQGIPSGPPIIVEAPKAEPVPEPAPKPAETAKQTAADQTTKAKTKTKEQAKKKAASSDSSDQTKQKDQSKAEQRSTKASSKKMSPSALSRKFPNGFFMSGSKKEKQVALTFDDAPDDKFTPQVLDILKENGVKATFFVVGWRADKYPDIVKRMVKEGHIIGNHSYGHANLSKLNDTEYQKELDKTQASIRKTAGYEPRLLRPPYGEITESEAEWAINQGFTIVHWNVDSEDWRQIASDKVIHNVFKDVRAGSIILQHSGGGVGQDLSGTVQALPKIIERLKSEGYKLVTLPELLGVTKSK
ncbi:polysaccharide deacetylase family protein [Paenibacillus turpanensis]|uniref:polysaccharide deacetylase family protein n=1 Tax=Paenibacillus turpanensis TaxID=2689078 RepID=UPI0014087E61|nr:polysaccharide deacetylase family protein [Paenibacillus turpanensis]